MLVGLEAFFRSAGTPTEPLLSRPDIYRSLARSSKIGIWIPGVVTVDVGAVEKPAENSLVRDVPKEGVFSEAAELSEMQDIDPLSLVV